VDVLTGIIKANFPTRLSFQVSSKTDSRTIIDANGAENLLGSGDMLFVPPGAAKLQRIHGAYISESELARITAFLKQQKKPEYDEQVTAAVAVDAEAHAAEEHDEKYDDAVALVTQTRQASISMIQRHLRIGYNRAARIIEVMEKEGVVGPSDGVKPREVLVRSYDDLS
jgi:S-DNA-T family DNA segregation ATPase FtsK/SpoIIIE